MQECAGWLRSLGIGSPRRHGALSVWPLSGGFGYLDLAVEDLDERTMDEFVHESGAPAGRHRWRELVVHRGRRPVLVLQGQELETERYAFEVLAPRLARPGAVTVLLVARGEVPEEERSGPAEADGLLARVAAPPEMGTVGYLACVAGQFVRLELFPNPWFC